MNSAPTLDAWWELFCVIALGSTLVVACAAALQAVIRSSVWHRSIWQVSTLVLATLALIEVTGLGRSVGQWAVAARDMPHAGPHRASDLNSPNALSERVDAGISEPRTNPFHFGAPIEPGSTKVAAAPFTAASLSESVTLGDRLPTDMNAQIELASDAPLSGPIGASATDNNAAVAEDSDSRPVGLNANLHETTRRGVPAREFAAISDPSDSDPWRGRAAWWPGIVWLAGALLVALRVVTAQALLVLLRLRNRAGREPPIRDRVDALARLVGQRSRVRLLESPGLSGPIAFGFFRPTIAVPAGFAGRFDPAGRDAILAHELAHLAAHDPAWHLAADVVAAIFWWQPLVWWSRHQLHAASESAADLASLVVANGPSVLAGCLVELGARLVRGRPAGWLGVAGSGFRSGLGRRVERLLKLNGQSWRSLGGARCTLTNTIGLVTLLCVTILGTAWVRPAPASKGDSSMKTVQQSWQRSVAALALAAAFTPEPELAAEQRPKLPSAQPATSETSADAVNKAVESPKVSGVIRELDYSTGGSPPLIEISIGSDDGVRKGHKLEVYRLDPPGSVGTIEISDVTSSTAKGQIVSQIEGDGPRKGDRVAERTDELLKILDALKLKTNEALKLKTNENVAELQQQIEKVAGLEAAKERSAELSNVLKAENEIAQGQLVIAREELKRAQANMLFTERLVQKGYATADQFATEKIALMKAQLAAKRAEQYALALGLYEASQKSFEEARKLAAKQQQRLAEDPGVPTSEKLKAIADELEQAKAKLIESFEAQIETVRKAIEESKTQSGDAKEKIQTSLTPAGQSRPGAGASGRSGGTAGAGTGGLPGGRGAGMTSGGGGMGRSVPAKAATTTQQLSVKRIRVFQLKQCEPESVVKVLEKLLDVAYTGPRAAKSGISGLGAGMPGGGMESGGAPGGPGGGGAMTMGMALDDASAAAPIGSLRIAVDTRTKSLIVRGTDEQLNAVAEIIAAFESPLKEVTSPPENLRVFRLRFASAKSVAELLSRLGLAIRIAEDESTNAVIVSGPKEEMEEIGELIKTLDVADPPASPDGDATVGPVLRPVPMPSNSELAGPPATTTPAKRNLEIRLTSDGRITMNGKAVEQAQFAKQLAELRKRTTIKGGLGPGKDYFSPPPVSIQVDEELPYVDWHALMSTLAQKGFVKLSVKETKPADATK